MKVLIVGGGIGGMALGAFLENSAVEYEIVEKAPDWSHMGFLISISDSGRDMLKKLGLAEKFDAKGSRVRTYSIRNGEGHILRDIDLTRLAVEYGSAITILPRAELHGMLLSKIRPERLRMNASVRSFEQNERAVSVTFSDGRTEEYDVVVGADGVHSQIRAGIFDDVKEVYENWRVWYMWVDHALDVPATITEYVEPSEFAIVCSAGNKTTAWLFAPADHRIWDDEIGRVERLKKLFRREVNLLPAIEKLRDEDVMPADMLHFTLRHWSSGRVVLLGDAAHSVGPLAGMGSTMAMEDSYTLAGELMRVSALYPLERAFENYEKKRRVRVARAEGMSRTVRWGMLVKSPIARKVMNGVAALIPERYLFTNFDALLRQEI